MYNDIITKIEEFDTIVIARHIGVDPDALCSQLALRDSIKLTFPEKKVLAIGTGSAKFTQLGRLDKIEKVQDALLIVADTPDKKRVDSVDFSQFKFKIKKQTNFQPVFYFSIINSSLFKVFESNLRFAILFSEHSLIFFCFCA